MECGMVGWSASRLAGCLAASLPLGREPTNTDPLFFSLSLPTCITLCACTCMHTTRVWKMRGLRVCAEKKKKKAEGWRRGVLHVLGEVSAKKKFFNARSQVTVEGEGRMGHEILVSALFFFFFSLVGVSLSLVART